MRLIRLLFGSKSRYRNKSIKTLGSLIFALSILFVIYLMIIFGPKKVSEDDIKNLKIETQGIIQLRNRIEEAEKKFNDIKKTRTIEPNDLWILEQIIILQSKLYEIARGTQHSEQKKIDQLKKQYDQYQGKFYYDKSKELEDIGRELFNDKIFDNANLHLVEALKLQSEINEKFKGSEYRNLPREEELRKMTMIIKTRPAYEKSIEEELEYNKAVIVGEFQKAKHHLREAINLQNSIVTNFRDSEHADQSRLERLGDEMTLILTAPDFIKIEELLDQALHDDNNGNYNSAAKLIKKARLLQQKINEEYPDSKFASLERIAELETLRQSNLSHGYEKKITEQKALLNDYLANRKINMAIQVMADLFNNIKRLNKSYPHSKYYDKKLVKKLRYLRENQDEISYIQNNIYDNIINIPNDSNWKMYRYETSQVLYTKIMGTNPSRNSDDHYPVDSVKWDDAMEFCKRLGWMLGKTVSLPTKSNYYNALSNTNYSNTFNSSWHSQNSGNTTHPVGEKLISTYGYYDLLGNVAEWTLSTNIPNEDNAWVIGGSAGDSVEKLVEIPLINKPKIHRNRFIGFRIVVSN